MTDRHQLPDFGIQAILEKTRDGVIVTKANPTANNSSEIVYVNPAMERISGYTSGELLGNNPRILQCEQTSAETRRTIKQSLSRRQPVTCSILNARKDGELYWIELNIMPVENRSGVVTHFASLQHVIDCSGESKDEYETSLQPGNYYLLNKGAFLSTLDAEWNRAYRHHTTFSLLCIRITITWNYSGSATDLFSCFAMTCHQLFRKEDTFGRIEDNEFAILMPETDLQLAKTVLNRLMAAVSASAKLNNLSLQTGVAELCLLDKDAASIIARAREYET